MPFDGVDSKVVPARPAVTANSWGIEMLQVFTPNFNGPIRATVRLVRVGKTDPANPAAPWVRDPNSDPVSTIYPDLRKRMLTRPSLAALIQGIEDEIRAMAIEDGLILPEASGTGQSTNGEG